jgi:hypothetical protein
MTNSKPSGESDENGRKSSGDRRAAWERPALRRLASSEAEVTNAHAGKFDGMTNKS